MMPRLHVITDDAVLARPDFGAQATALMAAGGPEIALHMRGHATAAATLFLLTERLLPAAREHGTRLLVNDRLDVARAAQADGVQLGRRSLPVPLARSWARPTARLDAAPEARTAALCIGYSAHSREEAVEAERAGADFILIGAIWSTATHPRADGQGTQLIRVTASVVGLPLIAIGGITPERAAVVRHAGAHGIGVLGGIWNDGRPAAALARYRDALRSAGLHVSRVPERGAAS
jgi:thiamine-phosphate pyrophosphorylase